MRNVRDQDLTKKQLSVELETLRRRVAELEALELEFKRAEADLVQRNQQLLSIQAAALAITSSLDLEAVLKRVATEMIDLLQASGCVIYERNLVANTITIIFEVGPDAWHNDSQIGQVYQLADFPATKQVLLEQQARQMTIDRLDIDPAELAYMQQFELKTLLMLPMVFQERLIGLLEIVDEQVVREFDEQEVTLAQLLANQAASAIANSRLYAETRQQLKEQTALREAIAIISSTLDLKTVLTHIAEQMCRAIDVTSAYICDYEPETHASTVLGEYLSPHANSQERASDLDITYNVFDDFPNTIRYLESGQPRVAHLDHPGLAAGEQNHMAQYGVQSILTIPLKLGDQLLGFAELWESRRQRDFTADEIDLCRRIAQHAAIAILNAQLFAGTQRYADELERRVIDRTAELTKTNAELQAEIIERQRVEEQLIVARDRALAASRFKTELVAKVSHELRTPLSAILGLTELLGMEVFGPVTGEQIDATAKILDSTHYLTSLVNELLNQARLDAGRFSLKRDTYAPAAMLERVESKIIDLARNKGLNLVTNIAADVPELVSGDSDQVQQILVNLVGNAIKFTNEGAVTVTFYCSDPTHWALQVTDTGPGIPADAQAYIFEPFRQVDGSMTRQHQGAGLGLSIVKQLVDLMGGQITVASKVGQGSTFTVVLPL
ncbi:MAG TPA: ATP-binding protein [Anaerolineae bacterium]